MAGIMDWRDIFQDVHEIPASAWRTTLVDSSGTWISGINPLPVTAVSTSPITPYSQYGSATVVYNAEVTLINYTVPSGKTFSINNINLGGDGDGKFNIYVDLSLFMVSRNSASERTKNLHFTNFTLTAGQILDIKVKNIGHKQQAQDFEITLIGGIA